MNLIEYEGADGLPHLTLVRDDAPAEDAPAGIPHDPPAGLLDEMNWAALAGEIEEQSGTTIDPERLARDVWTQLVRARLVTWDDVQLAQTGVRAAVTAAVREQTDGRATRATMDAATSVVVRPIVAWYRYRER